MPSFHAIDIIHLVGLIFVVIFFSRLSIDFEGVLFFSAFGAFPFLINQYLTLRFKHPEAKGIVGLSSLLYIIIFFMLANGVVSGPQDPQSGIAFLFIGIYFLPLIVVFWLMAQMVEIKIGKQVHRGEETKEADD